MNLDKLTRTVQRTCARLESNLETGEFPIIADLTNGRQLILVTSKRDAWFAKISPQLNKKGEHARTLINKKFSKLRCETSERYTRNALTHALTIVERDLVFSFRQP